VEDILFGVEGVDVSTFDATVWDHVFRTSVFSAGGGPR